MSQSHVLVVEDDDPTRERLCDAVQTASDLSLAGAARTFREAQQLLQSGPTCQVMLVDLGLPDGNGIDLIVQARAMDHPPEVMVISVFGDKEHVIAAIEAGATGYLLKDANDIAESIRSILKGGSPISSSIARHLLKRFQTPEKNPTFDDSDLPKLTARETEILQLVAKGFSYAEIAELLSLSVHTVTTHIKNTYRKLEVRSRGEAVFEAARRGIVEI